MTKFLCYLLVVAFAAIPFLSGATMQVSTLRCEYKRDPIGIDSPEPRLSWTVQSAQRGQAQAAYQILAGPTSASLNAGVGVLWDSGKVASARPFNVAYAGTRLGSSERVYWKVRVFDDSGKPSPWSRPAFFEMGLLDPTDWKGNWINDGKRSPRTEEAFYKEDPAPLFRKQFQLPKEIRSARLYIAGLGYWEASLNGKQVGDQVLDPGWTDFSKRVGYSAFDVTKQIRKGANCLGVMLGKGWYDPLPMRLFGQFNLRDHLDIGRPRFIAQLNVEFEDGSTHSVVSDVDWRVGDGPIRFDNIYLGEVVDARLARPGWSSAGYDDSSWSRPAVAPEPIGALRCAPQPPIRITEHIPAARLSEPKSGVFIYDFGQIFAGWARMKMTLPAGTRLTFRYGELLNPDGTLNPLTSVAGQIKWPKKTGSGEEVSTGGPGAPLVAWQSDTYICSGQPGETFAPHFTFHGFRYVEVTGLPKPPALNDVEGLRLNSDVESAGSFSCSNEMFNRIQQMCRRTFLSNILSVQSDCPHRERLGYGGDMVGTSEAFLLNFDMSGFYAKTVQDFADAARPDGMLTDTAPFIGIQYCGVGWAMAHPLLASQLDRYYGDRRLVEQQYEAAKKWLLLVSKQYPDGIVTDGLSDHESLNPNPSPVMVTPLYFQLTQLLAKMARDLGKPEDAAEFDRLALKIQSTYDAQFIDPLKGTVGPATQGSQSFALYSGIVPDSTSPAALAVLVSKVRDEAKGHLSTGLMGTKFMLDVLSREGHAEDAYTIVNQRSFPGWGWMLENGATTLWEHWEKEEVVYSHCHPMFGSVSQWFINWLGGIQQAPDSTAFEHIVIRPQFVQELQWVKSRHTCMYGEIVSNWHRAHGSMTVETTIPSGASGEIFVPARRSEDIAEGGRPLSQHPEIRLESNGATQRLRVPCGHYVLSFPDPNP